MSIIITSHILLTPPVFLYLCFMTSALLFLHCVPKISSQNVQVKGQKKTAFDFFLRKKNLCTTFYAFYILTLISTGCSQKKCHNTLYTVTSLHITYPGKFCVFFVGCGYFSLADDTHDISQLI